MPLRYIFPWFDRSSVKWSADARVLRWLTLLWLLFGLVVLCTASYVTAATDNADGFYYLKRQFAWAWIGMVLFNLIIHTPIRFVIGMAHWFLLLCLLLIFLTHVPGMGATVNGATRWLVLGPISLQPSELIKPFLVLQGARIFSQWERLPVPVRWRWLGTFALVLGAILTQPNLSTASLCGMLLWLIALAAGLPLKQLGGTALAGFLLAVLSVSRNEYQWLRITSFLDPWSNTQGDSYQLVQSLLAIGSGGMTGTGFGLSQQKMFYLPFQYTDFIFAVFAEEFGLIGGILLLLMLAVYATMGLRVALKASRDVHQLVAIGAIILLIGQSILNIAVSTGSMPTTGLPMPMMSYGGNSILASLMAAALLIRVARESSNRNVIEPSRFSLKQLNSKAPGQEPDQNLAEFSRPGYCTSLKMGEAALFNHRCGALCLVRDVLCWKPYKLDFIFWSNGPMAKCSNSLTTSQF
ncbi:MAG: FtsW/RodA/SpoVE family cell cycle protein [Synechococcales cyanobacterium CRU_2_2]|nr:FtsW/RodA/SpoVE family cell cycle protein [Synechococcales cyanobacterium CRU_2_2]